jgi:hypothetical protein
MRNVAPAMSFVQPGISATAGAVGIAVEGLNASIPGDDKYHDNSGKTLTLPPLDPYGPSTRWFDVFSRGIIACDWSAQTDKPWVKLSQYNGTVGPGNGTDSRVYVSIDWATAPQVINNTNSNINFTTGCGRNGFATWYGAPVVILPINLRSVPSNFTTGFVESDKHIAIEGPNYQRIQPSSNSTNSKITYHTLKNYGRTYGGVSLWPQNTLTVTAQSGPALEYDLYLFTNISNVNVTLYLSPTQNYLSDNDPLHFAVSLFPAGSTQATPQTVRYIGDSIGQDPPVGWGYAVGDAVWGRYPNHNTTTRWNVTQEGAYKLRVWALAPSIIVQKVIVDLGGVRPSYLGPPESFLVGRDKEGSFNGTSFANQAAVVGAIGLKSTTQPSAADRVAARGMQTLVALVLAITASLLVSC